jgi:TatD DNase family protein
MLQAPKGRKLLETVPLERVLTETDAPFQSDEKGGNSPGDVRGAIRLIANAYSKDNSATEARIRRTATELLAN